MKIMLFTNRNKAEKDAAKLARSMHDTGINFFLLVYQIVKSDYYRQWVTAFGHQINPIKLSLEYNGQLT